MIFVLFDKGEWVVFDGIEVEVQLLWYGIDCYVYCMVVVGYGDVVIEFGLQVYDIVVFVFIVEGVGGVVIIWIGGSLVDGGQILVFGDKWFYDIFLICLVKVG